MAMRSFQVVVEWDSDEKVWVTYVPTLDFLSTYGETKEEAINNTREAILGYIEAAVKEGLPITLGRSGPGNLGNKLPGMAKTWLNRPGCYT